MTKPEPETSQKSPITKVDSGAETEDETSFDSGDETEDEPFHAITDTEDDEENAPTESTQQPQQPQPQHNFQRGQNVTVTMDNNKVYLGQLFKIEGDKYHVYFVDNSEVAVMRADQLGPDKWNARTRAQYLNAESYCDGVGDTERDSIPPGRWKVRRIEGNEYVCVRLSGGGPTDINRENFDIGYVMSEVRAEEEYVRERGPFCLGRGVPKSRNDND